jgi:hypothetical protein
MRRIACVLVAIALIELYILLLFPRLEKQALSGVFRIGPGTIRVRIARHRWSVIHEGFGIPSREGWVEWR